MRTLLKWVWGHIYNNLALITMLIDKAYLLVYAGFTMLIEERA
jgi:hypothetical protein